MLMKKELNYITHCILYVLWIAEWSAVMKPNSHPTPHHSPAAQFNTIPHHSPAAQFTNLPRGLVLCETCCFMWWGEQKWWSILRSGVSDVCKEPKHRQTGNGIDTYPHTRCLQLLTMWSPPWLAPRIYTHSVRLAQVEKQCLQGTEPPHPGPKSDICKIQEFHF